MRDTKVSQQLARILEKIVRLDLQKRYQSASQVLKALRSKL